MRQDEDIGKENAGTVSNSKDDGQKKISDEEIKSAILSIIGKHGSVRSQEELASLVSNEINENVQPQKIRVLALELPDIEVRVLTKCSKKWNFFGMPKSEAFRAKSNREKPSNCPSCGKPLKALYAKNLLDKKVVVGLECNRCLYRGTLKSFAPFRYEFTMRK